MRRSVPSPAGSPGLARDARGAVALEFALILPVLLTFFFGIIEVALSVFINSSIESAVFEASRFGVTGGTTPGVTRQDRVLDIVGERTYGLVDMDTVTVDTLVYDTFSDIGKPEPFVDANANAVYDAGETFTDVNGNGVWDADMGLAGLGGPSDVVVYQLTYDWGIVTPLMRRVMGNSVEMVSSVAVRNEPF